jgi:hypothetical protein
MDKTGMCRPESNVYRVKSIEYNSVLDKNSWLPSLVIQFNVKDVDPLPVTGGKAETFNAVCSKWTRQQCVDQRTERKKYSACGFVKSLFYFAVGPNGAERIYFH